jgi:hypothetical protein
VENKHERNLKLLTEEVQSGLSLHSSFTLGSSESSAEIESFIGRSFISEFKSIRGLDLLGVGKIHELIMSSIFGAEV